MSKINEIVVLGASFCEPCKMVKRLATMYKEKVNLDVELVFHEIDKGTISKADAEALAGRSISSVPVILIDGKEIQGGTSAFQNLMREEFKAAQ